MSHTSKMSKILWGEGLFLRPQHFQRQDAYHEARLHDLTQTQSPYGWGVRRVTFDPHALASGVLRPIAVSAIFPDGETYSAPDHDLLPEALSLQELQESSTSTTVYLALPLLREEGGNYSQQEATSPCRFKQVNASTHDLFTSAAEADLSFLAKSARLLIEDQPRDAYISIPVARIRRTSSGSFELDTNFIPPCASIDASPMVQRELRSILDALQAKVDALYGLHRQTSQNIIEFRSGDIASFWLLHTINTAFGALAHFAHNPKLHPERLHLELIRLASALLTFSNSYQLSELPAYRHEQPEASFQALFDIIRILLDTVISTRYFKIALSEVKPSFHLGHLDSQRIDGDVAFYLAISASMPAQELIQSTPIRFKIGAPDDVEKCVLSALPGVKLTHAAQVPAAIPVRPGSHYFALDPRGALYERMLKSQSLMIYVPSGISDLTMELVAVAA